MNMLWYIKLFLLVFFVFFVDDDDVGDLLLVFEFRDVNESMDVVLF